MYRSIKFLLTVTSPAWLACCSLEAQEPTDSPHVNSGNLGFRNLAQPDRDFIGDPLPPQAIMRFGTLRFLHPSSVTEMVLAPDEKTVVTLNGSAIIAWDAATGLELWRQDWRELGGHIMGPAYGQRYAAFGSDSAHFYTTSNSNKIYVWDTRGGSHDVILIETNLVAQLFGARSLPGFASIDVKQDATRFLTGSSAGLKLYDGKGKQLWALPNKPEQPLQIGGANRDRLSFSGDYSTGIFSPDERRLACVLSQSPKQVVVLDAETGQEQSTIALGDKLVRMAFSADGSALVATERDCATRCYSLATQQLLWEHIVPPDPKNAESYTSAVDCSDDGRLVAVGAPIGPNNWIYLLDAVTGKEVAILRGHTWKPWAVKFTKDSQTLYSTGWDAAVRRWDVRRAEQLPLPQGIRGGDAVSLSGDGRHIAFADGNNVVHVLDAASGSQIQEIHPLELGCSVLTFTPDGQSLFVGGQSRASELANQELREEVGIQAWELSSGAKLREWRWPRGQDPHSDLEALAISPDNRFAAAAVFRQSRAYLWDIEQDKQLAVLMHNDVYGLDISKDSRVVATVGWDSMLRLWHIETGEQMYQVAVSEILKDHVPNGDLRMYGVRFSPDGKHLAAAHMDGTLSVWDVGEPTQTKLEHFFELESRFIFGALDYSPDGLWLALGGSDGSVKLFDAHLGVPMWTVGQHPEHVYTVAFGADSRSLVSGGGGISYAWSLIPQAGSDPNDAQPLRTAAELDVAWKSLGSQDAQVAYRAIWALADTPAGPEYLADRLMQIQTVLDPQAITRGQSPAVAAQRLELAAKASGDDNKIEFLQVVHRALVALRLSKAPEAQALLEQLYDQQPAETVHQLVARVR